MAVQLLPFQKIVDMPDVAQEHLCKIRGLAISSIVLVMISMVLFVFTVVTNKPGFVNGSNAFLGVPSMVVIFFLVLIASVISLRNTGKWESTDVCCNLMRSRPACCTRSCSSSKSCCARLSCVHIAITVFTAILCTYVCIVSFLLGCTMPYEDSSYDGKDDSSRGSYSSYSQYSHYTTSYSRYRRYTPYRHYTPYPYRHYTSTTTTIPRTNAAKDGSCGLTAMFGVPALILMICLVGTTAASAYFLRQVENAMPAAEVLPPGKMVTLVASQEPTIHARLVTGNDQQEHTKAGVAV